MACGSFLASISDPSGAARALPAKWLTPIKAYQSRLFAIFSVRGTRSYRWFSCVLVRIILLSGPARNAADLFGLIGRRIVDVACLVEKLRVGAAIRPWIRLRLLSGTRTGTFASRSLDLLGLIRRKKFNRTSASGLGSQ